jgi:hypothetical protein
MTPSGIKPVTFRFVAQHLNHCATVVFYTKTIQGPAEIPDDLATQLSVEPLVWGICPWEPFQQDSKHFSCHGALVCTASDSVPSHNTVLLWVRNFRQTVYTAKRKPPGTDPSLRTPENIEQVCQAFVRSPRPSASRNVIALRMSDNTVCRILHEDLNFHPSKMVMVQAINDQDTVNWKTVCEVLLNALDNDDVNHVLMTDEENFNLCGNVNSQNCRYWATKNHCDIHQKPLHSEKVIVWCGVASFGVMAPISLKTRQAGQEQ